METNVGSFDGVQLDVGRFYADDSLSICAWSPTEGPLAKITTCLGDRTLARDEAYVDTNNCPWAMDFIRKYGLGRATGKTRRSGYCAYPAVLFDAAKLEEHAA